MDSLPGTLMLTDCLNTCLKNATCQSVNYETGLCVLFSAHADQLPGTMIVPFCSRTVELLDIIACRCSDQIAVPRLHHLRTKVLPLGEAVWARLVRRSRAEL